MLQAKGRTEIGWVVFEFQVQYLVLQKAQRLYLMFAGQTDAASHTDLVQTEQASIKCKAEFPWDFAQGYSLNFWRFSPSL